MRFPGLAIALIVVAAVLAPGNRSTAGPAAAGQANADDKQDDADDTPVNSTLVSGQFASKSDVSDFLSGGLADRLMVFSGFDIWRGGLSGYAGLQWAPSRLDREGFILRMMTSTGIEQLTASGHRYQTHIFRASLMPGYKFKNGNLEIQLLAGIDFERDLLTIDNNTTSGRSMFGARVTADLWWEPTPHTMAQASISASTIYNSGNIRIAAGWRGLNRFWIGPEVLASRDLFSQQVRVGAHLTGLRTGALEWAVAAGYIADNFNRDGVYGRVGMFMRWGSNNALN